MCKSAASSFLFSHLHLFPVQHKSSEVSLSVVYRSSADRVYFYTFNDLTVNTQSTIQILRCRSGLKPGDIITHVNGVPVKEVSDIYILHSKKNAKLLKMDLIRDGKKTSVSVKTKK